jgi:hypothetical protein
MDNKKKNAIILHPDQVKKNTMDALNGKGEWSGWVEFPESAADVSSDFIMGNMDLVNKIKRTDDGSFEIFVENDFVRQAMCDKLNEIQGKAKKSKEQYASGQRDALKSEEFKNTDEGKEYFGRKSLQADFTEKSKEAQVYRFNLQQAINSGSLTIDEAISLSTINNGELSEKLAELLVRSMPDEKFNVMPRCVITNPNTNFNQAVASQGVIMREGNQKQCVYFRDYGSRPTSLNEEEVSAYRAAGSPEQKSMVSNLQFSLLSENNGILRFPIDELEARPKTDDSMFIMGASGERLINNIESAIDIIVMQQMRERGITFVDGKLAIQSNNTQATEK